MNIVCVCFIDSFNKLLGFFCCLFLLLLLWLLFNFHALKGFNSHINSTRSHTQTRRSKKPAKERSNASSERAIKRFWSFISLYFVHHERLFERMFEFKMRNEWMHAWNVLMHASMRACVCCVCCCCGIFQSCWRFF